MQKNIAKIIIFFILFVFITHNAFSQNITTGISDINDALSKRFKLQAFQLQQFVNMFNFDEPLSVGNLETSRKTNLYLLINQTDTALLQKAISSGFIDTFAQINYKLKLEESNWHSLVYTQFIYKNKPVEIILTLKLIGNSAKGYEWIITNVRSVLFLSPITDTSKLIFINPQNNEIMFSELSKLLTVNTDDIVNLYEDDFVYSPLNSFRDYLRNKEIVFLHITQMQYVFINAFGFNITVDNFIRSKLNAGLLISSIDKYEK